MTSFQTACAAVADAIASGDFATAYSKYGQAEAILAGLAVELEDNGSRQRLRESLEGMHRAIQAAQDAAGRSTDSGRRLIRARTGFNG